MSHPITTNDQAKALYIDYLDPCGPTLPSAGWSFEFQIFRRVSE